MALLDRPHGPHGPPAPAAHTRGTVLFTRYAFMPNHLQRCGPLRAQDNQTIFEYAVAGETDPYFTSLLCEFQAAYPYLQLIARTTGHADPFDLAVVEAYWIGSDLLERVEVRQFHRSIEERFGRLVDQKHLDYLLGKAPAGARPHHSFNVFDVQRFTQEKTHTLHTMEKCRIGWGQVRAIEASHFVVEYQPLEWGAPASNGRGGLVLGAPRYGRVLRQLGGKGFADRAQEGDWISFHWDWACDVLTESQRAQLEKWTRHHLRLANETL
jgi:hypothetical protein